MVMDANGANAETRLYKPWGEPRYPGGMQPGFGFTGQRGEPALGLYDYKARFYDPALGRFIQADSIVPGAGNPSAWDRYAYALNNPVRYTDPSGHCSFSFNDGIWGFLQSCVVDVLDAVEAYQEGERRPDVLTMHATGGTDFLVETANQIHQLNSDLQTVFSDAPLSERLLPAVNVGSFAVGTAATIVGGAQLVKAGVETISVKTPYGRAWQSLDPDALSLRRQVSGGAEIYRGGALGKTNVAEGQFWAPENPLNPGYASRYGAGSYSGLPDFVIGGNLKPDTPFITRHAPGVGSNAGGALEIVTRANGVHINYFFMR